MNLSTWVTHRYVPSSSNHIAPTYDHEANEDNIYYVLNGFPFTDVKHKYPRICFRLYTVTNTKESYTTLHTNILL